MSLVFVAVERCVFFSSFLPISHSKFLKDNRNCDSFSHSIFFRQIGVETFAKKRKITPENDLSIV